METLSSRHNQAWLPWFLRGILILGFLVLAGRLADLQIIKGNYFRALAEGNRIRRVAINAPRGEVLARGGEVLVGNKEIKTRIVFDESSGYLKTDDITGVDESELLSEWIRDYKLGSVFAHVSGYLGEVSKEELGKIRAQCIEKGTLNLGVYIGRTGLEESYDCLLRGVDGEELVEVDSRGRKVRTLGRKEPLAGQNLKTSIDFNLQKKAAEAMNNRPGAVIVSDLEGRVLSLYSSPSFDPNSFVGKNRNDKVAGVLDDRSLPMFNRAISGAFHPGSVYKPIVAIAAIEEEKIDAKFIYHDTGFIQIGEYLFRNWYLTQYGGTEGDIGVVRAMARSTDTFFYKIGEYLGIDKIHEWSQTFGLGSKTGIDIPGEVAGLVPSAEWKMRVKGERWFLGNTYHVSIGQGDLAVTPLEMHAAIAAVASNGRLCRPTIAGEVGCRDLNVRQTSFELVRKGMEDACKPGGTGFTFFNFEKASEGLVKVACKTGTAETGDGKTTHAWFVAFAPADNPEIVATVLVEKGGEGSREAGPIAREIFDYWFGIKETPTPTVAPESD
jgi:penicillin-binding protein 2